MTDPDDRVARNRATPRRHTPGRTPLGTAVTSRVAVVTLAVLLLATAVLLAVLMIRARSLDRVQASGELAEGLLGQSAAQLETARSAVDHDPAVGVRHSGRLGVFTREPD